MQVAIATARQAHYRLPAEAFLRRGARVSLYTSTPRSRWRNLPSQVTTHWSPAPVTLLSALLHARMPLRWDELDSVFFDRWTSRTAPPPLLPGDLFLGAASSSLATGRAAQRRGACYVLDRSCPHITVQQSMLQQEARRVGTLLRKHAAWFLQRQLDEYESADAILVPSHYTRQSFPEHLRHKIILAPLLGRSTITPHPSRTPAAEFTVGVVGGDPLRKGFLYLLEAWKRLALPNARLRLRSGVNLREFPVLERLLAGLPNVEIVGYVSDIAAFYRSCDAFILPSIDDGFGMALFEAVGHGVPSIATRNCGASELLENERDLLLIDAFSSSQIETALLRLYTSPETREQLALHGQATVSALQASQVGGPYEAGIDQLLTRLGHAATGKHLLQPSA